MQAEHEWIKRDKAEEGSTLNKLLNKQGSPADANVEQTVEGGGELAIFIDVRITRV